jgi:hypothetical protein
MLAIHAPPRSSGKHRMKGPSSLLIAVLMIVLASCATSSATSAAQPFAFHQDLFGQSGFGAAATFRVPADRLLVIEAVTAQISLPVASQSVTLYRIATQTGNRLFFYNVPVFEQGDTGVFVAGQQIRLYAAPGSEVQLLMRRNANQGVFNFLPGLSGLPHRSEQLQPGPLMQVAGGVAARQNGQGVDALCEKGLDRSLAAGHPGNCSASLRAGLQTTLHSKLATPPQTERATASN